MRFSLLYPHVECDTYFVNKVHNPPTTGFTDLSEAVDEAKRLGETLCQRYHKRYEVRTFRVKDGEETLVHLWTPDSCEYFLPGGSMAKFTVNTIPADVERFWMPVMSGSMSANQACFDVEQEARDESAKMFSSQQGQKRIFLLEVVAVIDPIVPKVEWREDLKPKAAST